MKTGIHRSDERGSANHGWLDSRFSFSFADYLNRSRMGFGTLRVVNDDIIAPMQGFPMHPHENMEIVTIVTEGAVAHRDSLGSGVVIRAGEVQRMSAGKGIVHSEWNPSELEPLRLFQIWIYSRDRDIEPEYDQKAFELEKGELTTLVSGDARDGGLVFHQDAWVHRGLFAKGDRHEYMFRQSGNGVFLFVIDGSVSVNGETLNARDEMTVTEADVLSFEALSDADVLLMEVPMVR